MHPNSVASFAALDHHARKALVLSIFVGSNTPLTDRQVLERLGVTDPNFCRPRITELIELKKLIEVGKVWDPKTKRNVRSCINTVIA